MSFFHFKLEYVKMFTNSTFNCSQKNSINIQDIDEIICSFLVLKIYLLYYY
jgi:hypothetical protein